MHRWKAGGWTITAGIGALAALGACGGDDSIDTGELEDQLQVRAF